MMSNTEDDGEYIDDDYLYPSDFEDDMSEWVEVKELFQNVHEDGDANIDTSTIQEKYFQSSDLESDYDENDGGEEILDVWEDFKIGGEQSIDIGAPDLLRSFLHYCLKMFILRHFQSMSTSPLIP